MEESISMWSIILPCGVALITACFIYLQSWHHIKIKLVLERIKYIRDIFNYVGKNHTLFRLINNTRNIKHLWEQDCWKVKIHNNHALFIMSLEDCYIELVSNFALNINGNI